MFKLTEIASVLSHAKIHKEAIFDKISIDSRNLIPKECFIALRGDRFDGHEFIEEAIAKGAVAIISEKPLTQEIPYIQVENSRLALGKWALYHREENNQTKIIGVTGSAGKTTTKSMIASVLGQSYSTLAPSSSMNNDIGLPLTLLQLKPDHDFAVIEMGTNHFGEIAYLSTIAKPHVAVITHIGPAHLKYLGDLTGVARAKAEIFTGLHPKGCAILNFDDPFFDYLSQQTSSRIITFGLNDKADIYGKNIFLDAMGRASFDCVTPMGTQWIQLNILGEHHVMNALAAAAACYAYDIDLDVIAQGLTKTTAVKSRLTLLKGRNHTTIIDDSYSAIPTAVMAALRVLAHQKGKKVFVFGGMAELNPEMASLQHREIGCLAKALNIDYLLATNPNTKETVEAFGTQGFYFNEKKDLIMALEKLLNPETFILVKGSFSTKMSDVVMAIREEF